MTLRASCRDRHTHRTRQHPNNLSVAQVQVQDGAAGSLSSRDTHGIPSSFGPILAPVWPQRSFHTEHLALRTTAHSTDLQLSRPPATPLQPSWVLTQDPSPRSPSTGLPGLKPADSLPCSPQLLGNSNQYQGYMDGGALAHARHPHFRELIPR